jgi:lysophospholipase L1-like esterase
MSDFDAYPSAAPASDDTILFRDVSDNGVIPAGKLKQVTVSDLGAALGGGSGGQVPTQTVTSDYTATGSDCMLFGDTSGGDFTITLPAATGITGKQYYVFNAGTGTLTIGATIAGLSPDPQVDQYAGLGVVSDGTTWQIFGQPMTEGDQSFLGAKTWYGPQVFLSGITCAYNAQTSDYSIGANGDITVFAAAAGITLALPDATSCGGSVFYVKQVVAGSSALAAASGQTIDGLAELALAQNDAVTLTSDGSNWQILSSNLSAEYADQAPAKEYGLLGSQGITALYAAIANRDNAACNIVVIGDSITEGEGATAFADRWIANASRAIRAAYPTVANGASGGIGLIPIIGTGENTYTWPVALASGTYGTSYAAYDIGPVRGCAKITATTSFTFTAPAGTSSVKIMAYNDNSGSEWSWKIGSGGATTETMSGTVQDGWLTSDITLTGGQVLTIAWVSGAVYLEGIIHYAGDESSGVTFHGLGHFAWAASDWIAAQSSSIDWTASIAALSPAAIGIMLGANDAQSVDAATWAANLTSLTTLLRGNANLANVPLLPIIEYETDESFTDTGGWPAYAAAIRAVAAATAGAQVIDPNYRLPSVASAWGGGTYGELYSDALHPSNFGHALLGEIVAAGVRIA